MPSPKSGINTLLQIQWFFSSLVSGSSFSVKHQYGPPAVPELDRTTYERKPFGIMMCGQLYKRLSICQSAFFNEDQLICYLTKNASMKYPLTKLDVIKTNTASQCNPWSRHLVTRLHGRKCVTREKYITTHHDLSKSKPLREHSKSYRCNLILHQACEKGQLDKVKDILSHDLEHINCKGMHGMTPVMDAALNGHREVVEFLVDKGCDVTVSANNENNILHIACSKGHISVVEYIVKRRLVNINSREMYGRTAVLIAAENGHKEIVKLLIREGCNPKLVDKYSNTIFHMVCRSDEVDIAKYLITQNIVQKDTKYKQGKTPLMIAAWFGSRRVFDLLVDEGYSLGAVDAEGNSVLHVACLGGHTYMVKHIIKNYNVDIESKGSLGRTPLLAAAGTTHTELFDFLIRKRCNAKAVDDNKDSILHVACLSGHLVMVRHIIKQSNVDIDSRGYQGRTALMIAAKRADKAIFNFLVRNGCNVKAVDDNKNTILHLACLGGHIDMVEHIIICYNVDIESKGFVGRTPLLVTAGTAHTAIFDFLTRKGCNAKAVDDNKDDTLHVACMSGHLVMVRHIIKQYNVDIDSKGFQGRTALMIAAKRAHKSIFNFLVRNGCNVKAVDDSKNNILEMACLGGNLGMVKFIINQNKINIDSRAQEGRTPLLTAAAIGSESLFYLLEKKGCNITAVDDKSRNILHLACDSGNVRLVRYIITKHLFDIDCRDAFGMTPVLRAAYLGHTGLVKILKGEGCNMNAADDNGNNIIHTACFSGKVDLVKFLIRQQIVSVHDRNKHGQTSLDAAKALKYSEIADVLKGN